VVLDIGAGIAKFCIVAAATVDAEIRGIEHRPHFVEVGRAAAKKVGVNVRLNHGTLADEDPRDVDGIYLFNPFAENLCERQDHLDDTVDLSEARFWRDVAETEGFLRAARAGTRLVTYCGWGGEIPDDYALSRRERRSGTLELWVKTPGYSRASYEARNLRL
jgi:predicted RNA methylase